MKLDMQQRKGLRKHKGLPTQSDIFFKNQNQKRKDGNQKYIHQFFQKHEMKRKEEKKKAERKKKERTKERRKKE